MDKSLLDKPKELAFWKIKSTQGASDRTPQNWGYLQSPDTSENIGQWL